MDASAVDNEQINLGSLNCDQEVACELSPFLGGVPKGSSLVCQREVGHVWRNKADVLAWLEVLDHLGKVPVGSRNSVKCEYGLHTWC